MKYILPAEGFDIKSLIACAVTCYREVPKATSLMQHTTLQDTTELFCVKPDGRRVQVFIPKQRLYSVKSTGGGNFLFLRVALEQEKRATYWLMVCHELRVGCLFSFDFRKPEVKMPIGFWFRLLATTTAGRIFFGAAPALI